MRNHLVDADSQIADLVSRSHVLNSGSEISRTHFLGHAAKPYYETTNGVGLLLVALLELDSPHEDLGGAL